MRQIWGQLYFIGELDAIRSKRAKLENSQSMDHYILWLFGLRKKASQAQLE